jgi:hypothetical protein
MPTVRTTMQPDREIDVDDAEYLDLKRQGLLVQADANQDVPPATAAPAVPAKKTTAGAAGSKES